MKIKKEQKGSALVFTMILIANALIIITSIVFLSSMQNKSSGALYLTTKAFQKVDGGLEFALMKINDAIFGTYGFETDIDDLSLCDSFNTNTGECTFDLSGSLISIWFYDKNSNNVIINDNQEIGEVSYLKVSAKVVDGSNRVSRSLKVSLFTSP
jgi:hypothetical protein